MAAASTSFADKRRGSPSDQCADGVFATADLFPFPLARHLVVHGWAPVVPQPRNQPFSRFVQIRYPILMVSCTFANFVQLQLIEEAKKPSHDFVQRETLDGEPLRKLQELSLAKPNREARARKVQSWQQLRAAQKPLSTRKRQRKGGNLRAAQMDSRPKRLSAKTAFTAARSSSLSSARRNATRTGSAKTRKCPEPMQGSSTVMSFAAFGQPSKAPAAGRQAPVAVSCVRRRAACARNADRSNDSPQGSSSREVRPR